MASPAPSTADNVTAYLIEQEIATLHKDIYTGNPSENSINFFLVTDTSGSKPEQYYPIDYPSVQVAFYAQAKDYSRGMERITQAFHALNRKQNISIGEMDAMYAQAVQKPYCLGLDKAMKRWVFVFNVNLMIRGVDGQ